MAGPRPKRRGPNNGESVGGVWPDQVALAVRRDMRVSTDMIIDWMGGASGGKNVEKWVGGYLRANKKAESV